MNSQAHSLQADPLQSTTVAELDVDAELARFEAEQRKELDLPLADLPTTQWTDTAQQAFTASQRSHTTVLVSGLTMAHDLFVQSALQGIGYKVQALDCPDNEALRFGKEFGNRGQCNPTYFTVGNLIKHLSQLRDQQGLSTEQIIERYVFLTAGACGPCRFGTYVTEYRKALRDSGFDGFRVVLFQQSGGLKQATGEEAGLKLSPSFFLGLLKAFFIGDTLNALGYRIRPYEVEPGDTNAALQQCKDLVAEALRSRRLLLPVLWRCRRLLAAVKVDRSYIKPKVGIIGEFWAMTTEGDGNYQLQRFLESEGAEVDVQLITAWILYMIWQARWDTDLRANLRGADQAKRGLDGVNVRKRLISLWLADKAMRVCFQAVANLIGLHGYHLPDMEEVSRVSHEFYDNHLRGGEGHMEVGKLILNVLHNKVNMTVSVKPFGCMPSSSVSDGVQSLITEMYPQAIFLPIETTGDGAVNVYSRIQMQLFKAKQAAKREVASALEQCGIDAQQLQERLKRRPRLQRALHHSPHRAGCTAADLAYDVGKPALPLYR